MLEVKIIGRIRELCEERGWSLYRLSKASEIPYSTLCTMMKSTHCPSLPTLFRICDAFGITPAQFFDTQISAEELFSDLPKGWDQLNAKGKRMTQAYIQGLLDMQSQSNPENE